MIFYSVQEILLLCAAAIVIDLLIGDPKWPTHPVIWIGRFIRLLEGRLRREGARMSPRSLKWNGVVLTCATVAASYCVLWLLAAVADAIHPWVGYAISAWFISTTIAVKGLKDAAMLVYKPLVQGRLSEARKYTGYIVGRDTHDLNEEEAVRATVETVAENTVDAFVSPIVFALLGGAPLAMLYRAANTLDSMVGYRNETYLHFGWCSARLDDVLNYIPARITGMLMIFAAWLTPDLSGRRSWQAVRTFAALHPSPNSGIPESAFAGAAGVQLGGVNRYFGIASERARMGWPIRGLESQDIRRAVKMLYSVCLLILTGVLVAGLWVS